MRRYFFLIKSRHPDSYRDKTDEKYLKIYEAFYPANKPRITPIIPDAHSASRLLSANANRLKCSLIFYDIFQRSAFVDVYFYLRIRNFHLKEKENNPIKFFQFL